MYQSSVLGVGVTTQNITDRMSDSMELVRNSVTYLRVASVMEKEQDVLQERV